MLIDIFKWKELGETELSAALGSFVEILLCKTDITQSDFVRYLFTPPAAKKVRNKPYSKFSKSGEEQFHHG